MVDQDAPHGVRRDREKMAPAFPPGLALFDEPEERLVHERGRLQRVSCAFAPQGGGRQAAQFRVHGRTQAVRLYRLARCESVEESGDVAA